MEYGRLTPPERAFMMLLSLVNWRKQVSGFCGFIVRPSHVISMPEADASYAACHMALDACASASVTTSYLPSGLPKNYQTPCASA